MLSILIFAVIYLIAGTTFASIYNERMVRMVLPRYYSDPKNEHHNVLWVSFVALMLMVLLWPTFLLILMGKKGR